MLFKKKKNVLKAYASGAMIEMKDVDDAVFSQNMMGEGVAIIPSDGVIYAPCDGIVTATFEITQHALGITMVNGMELLLHVGVDTVNLRKPLFHLLVKKGDHIKTGQRLIEYAKEQLTTLGYCDVTMLVILQAPGISVSLHKPMQVEQGITDIIEYT